jgi:hypothetical protein
MMFQILKLSEKALIALTIHRKIETFDGKAQSKLDSDNGQIIQVVVRRTQNTGSKHISLGSPSPSISIAEIEQWHMDDLTFTKFHKKIGKAFSNYFNEHIKFNAVNQVCRQRFLNSVKIM